MHNYAYIYVKYYDNVATCIVFVNTYSAKSKDLFRRISNEIN